MVARFPAFRCCRPSGFFAGLLALHALLAASLGHADPPRIRVATFNASQAQATSGALVSRLASGGNANIRRAAEIIQRVAPDVLLVNEFDYDAAGSAAQLFHDNFLAVSQNGAPAQSYPYRFSAAVNTGVNSGFDLDNSGNVITQAGALGYGEDCFGFGNFPGQYGMVVYSKFPIDTAAIRTFRHFLWRDMPGALLPDLAATPEPGDYYSAEEQAIFRLSSKSHWDLPIQVGGAAFHLLASHPTPPVFDGPEDRNGRRNHDEIRLWADYVDPARSAYLYDDAGVTGGLPAGARFVLVGDMNADPFDGDSVDHAARQITGHPLFDASLAPASLGGPQQSQLQGGVNLSHGGDPANDTADFGENGSGNVRVDYALPSQSGFRILDAGVFWPLFNDPQYALVAVSDHRLTWVDLELEPLAAEAAPDLRIARQGPDARLTWTPVPGYAYAVEGAGDLAAGGWGRIEGAITGPGEATVPAAAFPFLRLACWFE